MGISPLCTEHVKDAKSPELIESSPKSKGNICGATEKTGEFVGGV